MVFTGTVDRDRALEIYIYIYIIRNAHRRTKSSSLDPPYESIYALATNFQNCETPRPNSGNIVVVLFSLSSRSESGEEIFSTGTIF